MSSARERLEGTARARRAVTYIWGGIASRTSRLSPGPRGQFFAKATAAFRSAAWTTVYPVTLVAAGAPSVFRSPRMEPISTRLLPSVPNQASQAAMTFLLSAGSAGGGVPPAEKKTKILIFFFFFPFE